MLANARIQKARELLKDASQAFDADDTREGSRLMWEASKSRHKRSRRTARLAA